jgi:hypothetical protein
VRIDVAASFDRVVCAHPQWQFFLADGVYVHTTSLWRLRMNGKLKHVSDDHLQQFGLPAPVDLLAEVARTLEGRRLIAITIDENTKDMSLSFDGDIEIEVFTTSMGYESWELIVEGKRHICMGGGELATFPAPQG